MARTSKEKTLESIKEVIYKHSSKKELINACIEHCIKSVHTSSTFSALCRILPEPIVNAIISYTVCRTMQFIGLTKCPGYIYCANPLQLPKDDIDIYSIEINSIKRFIRLLDLLSEKKTIKASELERTGYTREEVRAIVSDEMIKAFIKLYKELKNENARVRAGNFYQPTTPQATQEATQEGST